MFFDAQWGDDFHNALHVLLTGEAEGYYAAFVNDPLSPCAQLDGRVRISGRKVSASQQAPG